MTNDGRAEVRRSLYGTTVGPNRWYDAGDERFHPENIITDDRGAMVFIISMETGRIVWKVGPDYTATPALRALGPIIGAHHADVIPEGLPGEGNILVLDNGGAAGFGAPNPGSPTGEWNALRDYTRILEFDPTTLENVWEYSARTAGFAPFLEDSKFYSHYQGGAQRLPNGNTLIADTTLRTHSRGHARKQDRVGVCESLQCKRRSLLEPHVSSVSRPLRVDPAAVEA